MHLLFLSRPAPGHLYPTLRLAEELGARGHRVTFASSDPYLDEQAEAGVRPIRFGRNERRLLETSMLGVVDAVVADPRTAAVATDLARAWDVPLLVAGENLPSSPYGWPHERAYESYVFSIPGTRGTVHNTWRRHGERPVLLVDGPPIGPLVRAFGETPWQVVVSDTELPHADVFLTDGRLAAVSAGLRAGVPMVLAPTTAEEVAHAERVAALGVGTVVTALGDTHAEELRDVVEHLRFDEPTRITAQWLRELVTAEGAPARAADRVTELLATPPLTQAA
ncbi:glycosyltransferase [Actinophytocola sp. NPDC049390]|uniref:glycosyltransferase n=1 Tax=Actinophytocola sp. NPDC049390 TaxID=3363894 RepID=UPI003788747E